MERKEAGKEKKGERIKGTGEREEGGWLKEEGWSRDWLVNCG